MIFEDGRSWKYISRKTHTVLIDKTATRGFDAHFFFSKIYGLFKKFIVSKINILSRDNFNIM